MGPYDKVTHGGKTVDRITKHALLEAEQMLGYELTIVQGSYNTGVSQSAGTHDGGGAIDLAGYDAHRKMRVLRQLGFAAWVRTPAQGPWNTHVHAVMIGNKKLSSGARSQVVAYLNGRNGLANNGPDDGPRDWVNRRYRWRRGVKRINRAAELVEQARILLTPWSPTNPAGVRGVTGTADVRKRLRALRDLLRDLG